MLIRERDKYPEDVRMTRVTDNASGIPPLAVLHRVRGGMVLYKQEKPLRIDQGYFLCFFLALCTMTKPLFGPGIEPLIISTFCSGRTSMISRL